jgi:hypothetical protein
MDKFTTDKFTTDKFTTDKFTTDKFTTDTLTNIDDEWADFVSSGYNCDTSSGDDEENDVGDVVPTPTKIYISTKTKIAYLNQPIDLNMFWEIPIIPYALPVNGVVKKQIKLNSATIEQLALTHEKLKKEAYVEENVITSIDNPTGRIAFKDIRKISVGISKKDLISYRCKKKSAFYNCFVLIFRMKIEEVFKEFHVKVFNTGKVEMPGVQNDANFQEVLSMLLTTLQPHIESKLDYKENSVVTVLINSNFKCGFYINRETLYDILRNKYNIQAIYDPCSYPGIQCKFYYNHDVKCDGQTGSQVLCKKISPNVSEVSFMIFRTGSVLIVGKCDDYVLIMIYEFLKDILSKEYKNICQKNVNEDTVVKEKMKKRRTKLITIIPLS